MRVRSAGAAPWGFASVLFLLGALLAIGGGQLVLLGGSSYYLLTGIAWVIAGCLLWRGRKAGMWLYLLTFGATVLWALLEIGLDGWSLASRIGLPLLLGLYFLLPHARRSLS